MSDAYREQLQCWFNDADIDGGGRLSKLELAKVLRKGGCKLDDDTIIDMFQAVDANKDDAITFPELWAALSKRDPKDVKEEELRSVYHSMDTDRDGFVEVEELKQICAKAEVEADVEAIVEACDKNQDGMIDLEEFLKAWKASE